MKKRTLIAVFLILMISIAAFSACSTPAKKTLKDATEKMNAAAESIFSGSMLKSDAQVQIKLTAPYQGEQTINTAMTFERAKIGGRDYLYLKAPKEGTYRIFEEHFYAADRLISGGTETICSIEDAEIFKELIPSADDYKSNTVGVKSAAVTGDENDTQIVFELTAKWLNEYAEKIGLTAESLSSGGSEYANIKSVNLKEGKFTAQITGGKLKKMTVDIKGSYTVNMLNIVEHKYENKDFELSIFSTETLYDFFEIHTYNGILPVEESGETLAQTADILQNAIQSFNSGDHERYSVNVSAYHPVELNNEFIYTGDYAAVFSAWRKNSILPERISYFADNTEYDYRHTNDMQFHYLCTKKDFSAFLGDNLFAKKDYYETVKSVNPLIVYDYTKDMFSDYSVGYYRHIKIISVTFDMQAFSGQYPEYSFGRADTTLRFYLDESGNLLKIISAITTENGDITFTFDTNFVSASEVEETESDNYYFNPDLPLITDMGTVNSIWDDAQPYDNNIFSYNFSAAANDLYIVQKNDFYKVNDEHNLSYLFSLDHFKQTITEMPAELNRKHIIDGGDGHYYILLSGGIIIKYNIESTGFSFVSESSLDFRNVAFCGENIYFSTIRDVYKLDTSDLSYLKIFSIENADSDWIIDFLVDGDTLYYVFDRTLFKHNLQSGDSISRKLETSSVFYNSPKIRLSPSGDTIICEGKVYDVDNLEPVKIFTDYLFSGGYLKDNIAVISKDYIFGEGFIYSIKDGKFIAAQFNRWVRVVASGDKIMYIDTDRKIYKIYSL